MFWGWIFKKVCCQYSTYMAVVGRERGSEEEKKYIFIDSFDSVTIFSGPFYEPERLKNHVPV